MRSPRSTAWFFAVTCLAAACGSGSDDGAVGGSVDGDADADPVVVLVHGSFHTPEATWAELTPLLDERGVEWTAVDLPSAGPDGTTDEPAPDLSDDVAVTLDAIEQVGGPVVLVGHSYGGAVITGAGVDPSVEHLFYLCAFAPERDETTIELTTSGPPVALAGALRIDDGLVSVDPALAVEVLYADVDPELAATMVAKLVPSTLSSLEQPVTDAAWMTVSSSYLICEQDEAIAPERQRAMADRIGAATFSLPSSHTPFLSRPGAVADLIEQVVQQAETRTCRACGHDCGRPLGSPDTASHSVRSVMTGNWVPGAQDRSGVRAGAGLRSCRAAAGRLALVARAHRGEHGDATEGRFTMTWASGARSTWRQVALVSVATLAAAACGGDDSEAGLETTTPTITTLADATTTDSTPAATAATQPAPSTAPPTQPADDLRFPVTVTEDVEYTSVDQLDVYAPATGSGWPVVVDFHGGFESRTPYPQGEFMAAQGVVVYRPTWASLGPAGGSEDTVCAMAFARATAEEHGGDPDRMLITGYSTGGFTAAIHALIGDDPPLPVTDCVVEPVMDAPAAAVPGGAPMFAVDAARAGAFAGNPQWSALSPEQLDAFDPYLNLGRNLDVRFVLVVGEEDVGGGNLGEIPIAASNDEFYAALRDAGYDADLVLLPGGHELVWGTDKAEIYAQTIVDTARSIGE